MSEKDSKKSETCNTSISRVAKKEDVLKRSLLHEQQTSFPAKQLSLSLLLSEVFLKKTKLTLMGRHESLIKKEKTVRNFLIKK